MLIGDEAVKNSNFRCKCEKLNCITQNEAKGLSLNLLEASKPQENGLLLSAISTMSHIPVCFSENLYAIEISFGPR